MNTPDLPPGTPASETKQHSFDAVACEPSSLTGDHWLELTATIPIERTEDFSAWMDRQLAAAERELAEFASPRSITTGR